MLRRATPLLWVAGVAGALWAIFPFAYPGYDTFYALVWGDELGHGSSPDYGGFHPPTGHPLADLWGAIVSPLGPSAAADLTTALAYLALGAIAYLVYRLGSEWFDRPIGVVGAVIVLTRVPILDRGLYAHLDMVFVALCLAALLVETQRPRAGLPVLALLAVAGLQRPEAWLFSAVYLVYMAVGPDPERGRLALRRRPELPGRRLAGLAAVAASAPIAWLSFDLITTGDPLYSLVATQERGAFAPHVPVSHRNLFLAGPRQLGRALQVPGLAAGGAGLVLGVALLGRRAILGAVAAVLAGAVFAVLPFLGLTINVRFTLLDAAVLSVFCAVALLGWRLLAGGDPWRRGWQLIAAALAVVFVVQAPHQYRLVSGMRNGLEQTSALESDLHRLADSGAFAAACRPLTVAINWTAPRLAAWLDRKPSQIFNSAQPERPDRGYYLDLRDGAIGAYSPETAPPGFRPVAGNESWLLRARCDSRHG